MNPDGASWSGSFGLSREIEKTLRWIVFKVPSGDEQVFWFWRRFMNVDTLFKDGASLVGYIEFKRIG